MTTRTRKRTAAKKASGRTTKKAVAFPEKQWEMPAGLHADGSNHATLRDVLDPEVATMQLSDLTLEQRAELVVKRLALQSKIELAMIGAGMIDKARAITEVKNKTKVGQLLIEIEHQMIRNLIEQSQKAKSAAGGRKPKSSKLSSSKSRTSPRRKI